MASKTASIEDRQRAFRRENVVGVVEASVPVSTLAEVLTAGESAGVLRCSKTHLSNLVNGKVPNTPRLPHIRIGRRVLIRREWIDQWMEANKRQ